MREGANAASLSERPYSQRWMRKPSGENEGKMGNYVESNLIAGEQIVYQTRLHPIVFLPAAAVVIAGIGVGAAYNPAGGLGMLVMGVALAIGAWIRQWASEFAVTNRRIIAKVGFISARTIDINMSKVESVEVDQNIFASLFNYGTITVIGTGGTKEPFDLIDDPLAFRRAVQSQQG
jgi:uncharacterized membrane protein YdbT with pleckstrin-like domain